jgi:hypothetical protein
LVLTVRTGAWVNGGFLLRRSHLEPDGVVPRMRASMPPSMLISFRQRNRGREGEIGKFNYLPLLSLPIIQMSFLGLSLIFFCPSKVVAT